MFGEGKTVGGGAGGGTGAGWVVKKLVTEMNKDLN